MIRVIHSCSVVVKCLVLRLLPIGIFLQGMSNFKYLFMINMNIPPHEVLYTYVLFSLLRSKKENSENGVSEKVVAVM